MGLIEMIFKGVFSIISLCESYRSPGACQYAPRGLGWQDFTGEDILNLYGFIIFFFLHNTCSYIDPLSVASFDPSGA